MLAEGFTGDKPCCTWENSWWRHALFLKRNSCKSVTPAPPKAQGTMWKSCGGVDVSARRIGGRTMKGHSLNLIYVLQSLTHISYSYLSWADIRSLQGPTLYLWTIGCPSILGHCHCLELYAFCERTRHRWLAPNPWSHRWPWLILAYHRTKTKTWTWALVEDEGRLEVRGRSGVWTVSAKCTCIQSVK